MGYKTALEAAGATVHAFEEFGSYQGDWWAKVTYDGKTGWINGSYGSCSGCDAFQSEFGYGDLDKCAEHEYENDSPVDCLACAGRKAEHEKRIAAFGLEYLDRIYNQEDAETKSLENDDWDLEAAKVCKFLKDNTINPTE